MSHLLTLCLIAIFSYIAIFGIAVLTTRAVYRLTQILRRQPENTTPRRNLSWLTLCTAAFGMGFFAHAFVGADTLLNLQKFLSDVAVVGGVLFIPFLAVFFYFGNYLPLSEKERSVFGAILFLTSLAATASLLLTIDTSTTTMIGRYPGTIVGQGRHVGFLAASDSEQFRRVVITIPASPTGSPLSVQAVISSNEATADNLSIAYERGRLGYERLTVGADRHPATLFPF